MAVEIDYGKLERQTLVRVIEDIITREGTDYGSVEMSLGTKVEQVLRQLESKKARLMFEEETESCSIELIP